MKKTVRILALALAGVLLFVSAAPAGKVMDRIIKTGELVVGTTASQPPMTLKNKTGHIVGLDADIARLIAKNMGVKEKFVTMPFSELLPALEGPFDLVFIDAEKTEYPEYFEAVLPKMRPGGLILLDNVLWSGKVVEPHTEADRATAILKDLNAGLPRDPRVRTVLLPIRDGLTVCMVE